MILLHLCMFGLEPDGLGWVPDRLQVIFGLKPLLVIHCCCHLVLYDSQLRSCSCDRGGEIGVGVVFFIANLIDGSRTRSIG